MQTPPKRYFCRNNLSTSVKKALFAFLISPLFVIAQEIFPVHRPDTAFVFFHENGSYLPIDTGISIYQHWNATLSGNDEYGWLELGNLGAPRQMLVHQYERNSSLQWGMNPYPNGRRQKEDFKYYNVKAPLVRARYLQGYERGQSFDITAALNVHERLGYNIRFQRLNSQGLYQRQMAEFNNFSIAYSYQTEDTRLKILGHFDSFSRRNNENGGLENEDDVRLNLQLNRELVAVRFPAAQSATRQRRFYTVATYDLGFFKEIITQDTNVVAEDSLQIVSDTSRVFRPVFNLGSSFEYQRLSYVFSSGQPLPFTALYDFGGTYDSTSFEHIQQRFFISTPRNQTLYWKAGIGYEAATYRSPWTVRPLFQSFIFGKSAFNYKGMQIEADGQLIYAGTQAGNFEIDGTAGYSNKNLALNGVLKLSAIDPGVFFQSFRSNYFSWNNEFRPVQHQYLGANSRFGKNLRVDGGLHLFQNYTVLDQQALPLQASGVQQLLQITANHHLKIGKGFGFANRLSYQTTGDQLGEIRVPEIYLRSTVYTNLKVYYQRLKLQPGLEMHFFTPYYAMNWMPVTGMFHLQDNEQFGGFPFVNFFVNIELKRALIYVKVENLTQDFIAPDYFIAPGHPLPDLVLRLGIKWDFFH